MTQGLADALRRVKTIQGWDWSEMRHRMEPFGWSYPEVLAEYAAGLSPVLDIGTAGGEVFSAVARPGDIALEPSPESIALARARLPCSLLRGDCWFLPFRQASIGVAADRHVGAPPPEVLRVLQPGGVYVTQYVGGHICQNYFDAFGWGSNGEFWARHYAEENLPCWTPETMAEFYLTAGCEVLRQEEAYVDYEFLDQESLAFWLSNAPLPEQVDPDLHAEVLERLPLRTNWHAQLLVVRRAL